MERTSTSFLGPINRGLGLINRGLHGNFDAVVHEPLPRRWVDLIHQLNDLERANEKGDNRQQDEPRSVSNVAR
jgi:hypothetical protein